MVQNVGPHEVEWAHIENLVSRLGYGGSYKFYFKATSKSLGDGLNTVYDDSGIKIMLEAYAGISVIDMFIENGVELPSYVGNQHVEEENDLGNDLHFEVLTRCSKDLLKEIGFSNQQEVSDEEHLGMDVGFESEDINEEVAHTCARVGGPLKSPADNFFSSGDDRKDDIDYGVGPKNNDVNNDGVGDVGHRVEGIDAEVVEKAWRPDVEVAEEDEEIEETE